MTKSSATEAVAQATSHIGDTFASVGERGLIIYALLLIIFLLLVRDFLKDWLIRSVSKEQSAANREVAAALRETTMNVSLVMTAVGVQQMQRLRDKGQLPSGVMPE